MILGTAGTYKETTMSDASINESHDHETLAQDVQEIPEDTDGSPEGMPFDSVADEPTPMEPDVPAAQDASDVDGAIDDASWPNGDFFFGEVFYDEMPAAETSEQSELALAPQHGELAEEYYEVDVYETPEPATETNDYYDDDAYDGGAYDDEAYDDATDEQPEESGFSRASDAAREAHRSLRSGIEAFRSVREASQRHSSARDELRNMREQLDGHIAELQHRIDIEQHYPQIISEQNKELKEATDLFQKSQERAVELDAERADLESQLSVMKTRHEDKLRPYRNVAESTKGRADDAARSLAEAKRAVKAAEGNLQEKTKRREQRIASANRAVDTARERQRKLQTELETAQGNSESSPAALERLQNELTSVQTHLDIAISDVPLVTEEANRSVEEAQQKLFNQRRLLEQAERKADAAKKEANDRRAEYDALLKDAQEEEKVLSERIKVDVAASEQAHKDQQDAEKRIAAAKAMLDEAEEIHSTPQKTIDLRNLIAREQTDLDVQQDAVDELAAHEKELRRGTLKQRLLVVAAGVAILAMIIAVVVAIVLGGRKAKSSGSTTQQTAVETTATTGKEDADEKASDKGDADAKASDEKATSDQDLGTGTSSNDRTDSTSGQKSSEEAPSTSTSTTQKSE